MKLEIEIPPGIVGVQFGLGHDCCARNSCSVGGVDESEGTVSLPFFGESAPVLVDVGKVPWCCESDGFPPLLMQTTVAEYVTLKFAVAFVLPTPASWYELHETLRPLTEQLGVPLWTCVPVGAAVGSNDGPDIAARADAADNAIKSTATMPITGTAVFFRLMMRPPYVVYGPRVPRVAASLPDFDEPGARREPLRSGPRASIYR